MTEERVIEIFLSNKKEVIFSVKNKLKAEFKIDPGKVHTYFEEMIEECEQRLQVYAALKYEISYEEAGEFAAEAITSFEMAINSPASFPDREEQYEKDETIW